ncbi:hypothetical protein ACFV3E_43575 [Streptomyces sp. NPDC059718]
MSRADAVPPTRLNAAEAGLAGLIFTASVVLKLTGMDLLAEMELLGTTGLIAAFVVAATTGRISPRAWLKKLGKLAGDDE